MRSYLDSIYELFREYYRNDSKRNIIRSEIERLVLTGDQILDSGITDFSEVEENYELLKEKLIDEKRELEEKIRKWKRAYRKLKELYQEQETTRKRIEKIIQGKRGTIIDAIEEVIK